MKLAKLLPLFAIIFVLGNLLHAQTTPNLENGWKPFGSYDGTHLDTVNLMNGNVIVHGPLTPDAPQRGSIKVSNTLYASSKDWQVVCHSAANSGQVCNWQKGGAGVVILPTPGLSVHRTVNNSYFGGEGNPTSVAFGYSIVTPDQGPHQLAAGATQFGSTDLSGYQVALSVPDPTTGVPTQVTVTDRSGNQYLGYFHGSGNCGRAPTNFMIGVPGPLQPMVDDAPAGEQYCPQTAFASLVTDSNGNQVVLHSLGNVNPTGDTLGRTPALTTANSAADFSGCVSSQPISSAMVYPYQDPNGVVRNIKFCAAEFPIHTAFNQPNGGGGTYLEAITSTDPNSGLHFIPVVTAVLSDGTRWTFDYDIYGEITSIGLPTGGSISYTWTTIGYLGCNDGNPTQMSRAVATRTLTDGQGHSYQWTYHWGTISAGSLTNVVTDPLRNDTAHVFSDLSLQIGSVPYCKFYETSTIQYQGAQSGNNPMQRADTTYSAANIAVDTDDVSPRNVFATDVLTTIYPSGKVKKVHKDPDTGLGANQPIFGNVKKEFEYDWGQGQPGPLLRETDTTYQWEINPAYLTAHLLDLPASVIVYDGAHNKMAETDYLYDEPAYLTTPTPAITTQHVSPPNGVRGNPTSVSHWLNTTNSFITSHTNWYDTGEPFQKIDPLGHTTALSYDSTYLGAYVTQTCSPQTGSVAHCVSGTYDFATGVLTSLTNENATAQASGNTSGDGAHTSNFSYDSMFRITSGQAPPDPANGGARAQTSFTFSAPNAFPVNVQRTKSITTALNDSATSFFDGLGRGYQSQHVLPNGTASVATTFDIAGRVATVSNPYFATSDPTYGITTSLYDALDRVTQTTKQDGSFSTVSYDQAAPGVQGICTISADEAGKLRRGCSDAMGRLVEVDEPNQGAQAMYAQASVTIGGSEQSNPLPASSGSGYVDIGGSELSSQVCTDPEPPAHPICHTVPDSGTVSIQVGTYPAKSTSFGTNSTGASIATALASAFHSDTAAPADAIVSPTNASRILFTARGTGVATNYAVSVSPTSATGMDFYGVPSGATLTGGRDASSSPDTGSVTISVNGTAYQTTYGGSDTASTIATRLASLITSGASANASSSGGTITITAKSTGPGGDYILTASSTYDSAHFAQASFTTAPSASALSGGYDAAGIDNQPLRTLYAYDALGNLLRVDQKGSAPTDSTQWRTRTFTYDSLSRLLTATNPESGTITYAYDADGELLQKTSPAPNQTGSATQTVSFCYDVLHRVTGRGYGAQSCPLATPVVSYAYDSGINAKGKLTSLADQAGTGSYSYDILGRLTTETRSLTGANSAAISKSLSYDYNLDGSLYKLHYPSGAAVTYAPGAAGLTLSAIDSGSGINYVTAASYGPDSGLTGFVSGNSGTFAGITNAYSYNKRLQPVNMSATAPSQTVFSIGYDFHVGNGTPGSGTNNGNVWGITNYKDTTRNQTFTYDALNRLISAQNAGTDCTVTVLGGNKKFWGNNYGYDAWGNLLSKSVTKCSAENLSVVAGNNNRLTGAYLYDAPGNMTHDATSGLNYTFDQENRLTGAAGYTYTYDGDGARVRKSNGNLAANGTLYWDMTPGGVAETDLAGTTKSEYIFFDGERVARRDGATGAGGVFYYFSDHLKTASVITDSAGVIKAESDYYPWGGELQFVNNDSNDYKFTGKKRDIETGLDLMGHRYYGSAIGRFVTTDPKMISRQRMLDPQQWNAYQYSRNNPTTYYDPDGLEAQLAAGMSAKDQAYVVNNLARMYSTPAGKGFLQGAANSKFTTTIGTGHLGRTKTGPAAPQGAVVFGGSEKVEGGNTRYGTATADGHKILVAQSPDSPTAPPIKVIIDKDQAAEIGKDPATVFAHELGGHDADVLKAAGSNVNQFIDGVDPKSEKSSEAAEKAATPLPKEATQEDINAVKQLLHIDDKKKEEPK
jgi:RHS repeat-associated protein